MARRTEEEKILFDPYCSLSTIQRYFSLDKVTAEDIFVKVQEADQVDGYIKIYDDRVRTEGVFKLLGVSQELSLKRYLAKKGRLIYENPKV